MGRRIGAALLVVGVVRQASRFSELLITVAARGEDGTVFKRYARTSMPSFSNLLAFRHNSTLTR
jgi:hypothetical protein